MSLLDFVHTNDQAKFKNNSRLSSFQGEETDVGQQSSHFRRKRFKRNKCRRIIKEEC